MRVSLPAKPGWQARLTCTTAGTNLGSTECRPTINLGGERLHRALARAQRGERSEHFPSFNLPRSPSG